MKVSKIDISDLHYNLSNACHQAFLCMEVRPAHDGKPLLVQFLCHANQPDDCPSSIVTHDLISDALRQAHRMPGFRRGEQVIEVEVSKATIAERTASG